MALDPQKVQELVERVNWDFPGWTGFDDPRFTASERDYKLELHEMAFGPQGLLRRERLEQLMRTGAWTAIADDFTTIAKHTNLMFLRIPSAADVRILFADQTADRPELVRRLFDLLYGEGPSEDRLDRWFSWAAGQPAGANWPFGTFWLFLIDPDNEMFLKPQAIRDVLRWLGSDVALPATPSGEAYAQVRAVFHELRDALAEYRPRDMLDIQSFVWVAAAAKQKGSKADQEEGEGGPIEEHSLLQMAEETGFELATLQQWIDAIHRKKQAILYGPPGTGKTFVAQRLADHIIAGGTGKKAIVQFHPAYAYEDFIQGLRPESDGDRITYPMIPGRFLEFCEEVRHLDGLSVLIIDEINRAELSRVFGELMYLLEYRDETIRLASGQQFSIPETLRIIGTMNTADRSIALVDNALRRRFAFLPLYPDHAVLRRFHERHKTGYPIEPLIQLLTRVNNAIDDRHFHVGVSCFMDTELDKNIEAIWKLEIEPYLDEYFFNRPDDVAKFSWENVKDELQAGEGHGGD